MKLRSLALALGLGLFGVGLGWFAPALNQPAYAQRGGVVELPIRVNAGDSFQLAMDVSVTDSQLGAVFGARMVMDLTIEQMGPEGGVWRWSFEELALTEFSAGAEYESAIADLPLTPAFNQTMSAAMRLMTDIDFVCRVNAQGACVELLNWPQWRERIENVVLISSGALLLADSFSPEYAYEAAPEPGGMGALQEALGAAAPATTTPAADPEPVEPVPAGPDMAQIANAVNAVSGVILDALDGRIVGSMFSVPYVTDVQGLSLREGQSQPTETLYPLPFGADPIRITGTVTLDDIDRRDGVARLTRTSTVDAASVTRGLTMMLQNGSGPVVASLMPILPEGTMGEDPQASAEFMSSMVGAMMASFVFSYEETGTAEVDLATGLVRSGTMTQVFSMDGPDGTSLANQTSVISFTLTPAAPRGPRLGAGSGGR